MAFSFKRGLKVDEIMSQRGRLPAGWMEGLESRQLLANAAPLLDDALFEMPAANDPLGATTSRFLVNGKVQVPGGKSIIVPVTASDANGDKLTYTFESSNPNIKVVQNTKGSFLRLQVEYQLTVNGSSQTKRGEIVLKLLKDYAPTTVDIISNLVTAEYYDNLTFHRVVPGFVVQGGDKAGTGSGAAPFQFDDEYNAKAIFSGRGQLAMAKSTDDSNGTQFFITTTSLDTDEEVKLVRNLDYNHTIFGQVVRGWEHVQGLQDVDKNINSDTPITKPKILKAELIKNFTDTVITISTPPGEEGDITVTVSDGKKASSRTFKVTAVKDTYNSRPYLPPTKDFYVADGKLINIKMKGFDLEKDAITYGGTINGGAKIEFDPSDTSNLKFYAYRGYVGSVTVNAYAAQNGETGTSVGSGNVDWDTFVVAVGDMAPTALKGKLITPNTGIEKQFVVATFKDTDVKGKVSDWSAKINWGDGTSPTAATIVRNDDGSFSILGKHKYNNEGYFQAVATLTSNPGGASHDIVLVAKVADAPLKPVGTTAYAKMNEGFLDKVVSSFKDSDTNGQASDFTIKIDWGDGTPQSEGKAVAVTGKPFNITGSHTYSTPGKYTLTAYVTDKGGSKTQVTSTVYVAREDLKLDTFTPLTETITEATPKDANTPTNFARTGVKVLSDFNNSDHPHAHRAWVDYGVGDDFQELTLKPDNTFDLGHMYDDNGTYKVVVVVEDTVDKSRVSETITLTVNSKAPTVEQAQVVKQMGASHGVAGQAMTIRVSATDLSAADLDKGFGYRIVWGDSSSSSDTGQTISTLKTGFSLISHTYATPGMYTIKVYAKDKDGTESEEKALTVNIVAVELQTDPTDSSKKVLVVGGTNSGDEITLTKTSDGKINVKIGSEDKSSFAGVDRILVFGQGGDDTITVDDDITIPAELHGGIGADKLFGGSGDDILLGEDSNNQTGYGADSLDGGAGDDILVGGQGNDTLKGDSGRDMLMGGVNSDLLSGGDGEDILIDGTTAHVASGGNREFNLTALISLRKEWVRTDATYAQRIAHLAGTTSGGLNGKYRLNSKTVYQDYAKDEIAGGESNDLFFANAKDTTPYSQSTKDILQDWRKGDTVTELTPD